MAEHKHGEMDISNHEQVYAGFIKLITRGAIASIALLLFIYMVNG
jgi:hypothetical protein